ncbi:MAG TPA: Spy/CpxP family protein refolding chaperone [Casimicrobiaceae bacterium]|nr:Spy/CpxP family protein refolding chaperone [Casimicrobiaceae bacterium]
MTRIGVILGIAIAGCMAMATGAAWGQATGGPGGGRASSGVTHLGGVPTRPGVPEVAQETLLGTVKYRLELLENDLRLRPEQNAAWAAYSSRVLTLAEDMQRAPRIALGGDLTAPKRLDKLADIARDRLTAIEDIVDAGKALYATLTPDQQMVADRRMAVPVMAMTGVEPASSGGRAMGPSKNP